jgi:tripartite-type tricarboxylate transporter receptor subunit TctC
MTIRITRRAALALPALFAASAARAQQDWPTRPVRLVVPFPGGGLVDSFARPYAQRLQQAYGQPAVVENRVGAGGNIGADLVAKSPADGHTLLFGSIGPMVVNEFLFPSLPFNPRRDFAPISLIVNTPKVLCVSNQRPWRSAPEVVAAAKAEPGRLTAGSAGNGSSLHLALELFNNAEGVRVTHVPYRGAQAAVLDVIAGRLDMIIDNVPNIIGQIRGEQVRPLAVMTEGRLPQLPNVPTFREAGLSPLVFGAWFCLVAPAGTPGPVIERCSALMDSMLRDPEVGGRFAEQGSQLGGGGPQRLAALIEKTRAQLEPVIRANNIRAE